MNQVIFLRPAEAEMLDAAQYYELQAPGLGDDFLERIEAAVQDIGRNPELWPIIQANTRRRLIKRFPFALLYRVDPDQIVIQATMHLHRRPDYWLNR